jgi:hypothetical protein
MTSILEACRENKYKFEEIENLAKEIRNTYSEKVGDIMKISNIYRIAFDNFYSKREPTKIKICGPYADEEDKKEGTEVYLNVKGISIKSDSYGENTADIGYLPEFHYKSFKTIKRQRKRIIRDYRKR